jgi:hypothetical protein
MASYPKEPAALRFGGDECSPADPAWADRRYGLPRLLLVPLAMLAAAVLVLPLDAPLAWWSPESSRIDALRHVLTAAEPFGDGVAMSFILAAVFLLDPLRRRMLPRVIAISLGAGLMANVVKLSMARMRPYHWMVQGHQHVADSFVGWLPLGLNRGAEQSFPSAHTAAAVGLALALAWLYPRGRPLFAALAVMVGLQRIVVDAHFASDVLAGAAVGWLTALACFRCGPLEGWFDWFEAGCPASAEGAAPQQPVAADTSRGRRGRRGNGKVRIDQGRRGIPR